MRSIAVRSSASRLFRPLAALALSLGVLAGRGLAEEGMRRIAVPRFGVAVTAPAAWRLREWSEDDRAFVLSLPQEKASSDGLVHCELALAPQRLADYQQRNRDRLERERRSGAVRRKLLSDALEGGDGAAEPRRLVTVWELLDENAEAGEEKRFEVAVRIVRQDTLYTFTLVTDEAHFAAYRADFDDLVASAQLTPPEIGLKPVANGYWLQSEFQFGLVPPAGWKPAFGSSDRALWFAHGAAHGVFVDNLSVAASARAPLDLAGLRDGAADAIAHKSPTARLVSSRIVPQGAASALETILTGEQDGAAVTIVERQFSGARRNYHVRVVCESTAYGRQEAEIRKSLDSFREAAEDPPPREL